MAYLVKAEAPNELTAQSTERQTLREKKKKNNKSAVRSKTAIN